MAQYQENATVTSVEQLSEDNFRMTFSSPQIAADARPGQFVMVRSVGTADPLLRRPFCVHQVEGDTLQIYFKVVGRGTQIMSQFGAGEEVSLLGPLGRGFSLTTGASCLVGGGLGIAPLLYLATELSKKVSDPQTITVILGGRTKVEVAPLVADFEKLGVRVLSATDDGSFGVKGFVTDILACESLNAATQVYTCGPEAMMSRIYDHCKDKGFACQVSVEKEMACGMGACLGCCKEKKDGEYTHVCINGPVYNAEELKWDK